MSDDKQQIVDRLSPLLARAATSVLQRFAGSRTAETMYAFTFVASPEGTYVCCAIATDRTLEVVAQQYVNLRYTAQFGETLSLLKRWLRWSNPDEGWHYYDFPNNEPILIELQQAFNSDDIERFDSITERVCTRAIQQLEQQSAFGTTDVLDRPVLSFTYGEDPQDFIRYAQLLNPPHVLARLSAEFEEGLSAEKHTLSPYRRRKQ